MKRLSNLFRIVLEDPQMQEMFLSFHSVNWKKLSLEEKFELLKKLNHRISVLYGYRELTVKTTKEKRVAGSQSSYDWCIRFNDNKLKTSTGYDVIDTLFHELQHARQRRAVEGQLTDKEEVDQNEIEKWRINLYPGNYFPLTSEYYEYQPVEKDAWTTGLLCARAVYFLNREKINEPDPDWEKYCATYRDIIQKFISENPKNDEMLAEINEKIEEIWASKMTDKEQIDLGKTIADTAIDGTDFSTMSEELTLTLLSPYVFVHLDIDYKEKVLKRYVKLLNVGSIRVHADTIESIKIKNVKYYAESPLLLVNAILTHAYANKIDRILFKDTEETLDKKAIEEIKCNMYLDKNNKPINFITDIDNLFLYSLQPYAKYESSYILSEISKIKAVELKIFGENSEAYSYWEKFYDNELIFNTASEIMGISFQEYYDNLIKQYKDNIDKYEKNMKKGIL